MFYVANRSTDVSLVGLYSNVSPSVSLISYFCLHVSVTIRRKRGYILRCRISLFTEDGNVFIYAYSKDKEEITFILPRIRPTFVPRLLVPFRPSLGERIPVYYFAT